MSNTYVKNKNLIENYIKLVEKLTGVKKEPEESPQMYLYKITIAYDVKNDQGTERFEILK